MQRPKYTHHRLKNSNWEPKQSTPAVRRAANTLTFRLTRALGMLKPHPALTGMASWYAVHRRARPDDSPLLPLAAAPLLVA